MAFKLTLKNDSKGSFCCLYTSCTKKIHKIIIKDSKKNVKKKTMQKNVKKYKNISLLFSKFIYKSSKNKINIKNTKNQYLNHIKKNIKIRKI